MRLARSLSRHLVRSVSITLAGFFVVNWVAPLTHSSGNLRPAVDRTERIAAAHRGAPARSALAMPQSESHSVRQLSIATKDIVVDPKTQTLYASVPSGAGGVGNSITAIDPAAGAVGASVFVGSEPGRLAISDDSKYIYAALDGAAAVRRFDLATQTAGIQFSLGTGATPPGFPGYGPLGAEDIAVAPGNPETVAVSLLRKSVSPRHGGVAVFDNGVQRPKVTPDHTGSNVIEFSNSPSVLYGYNNETTEFGFRKMAVSSCGVTVFDTNSGLTGGFGSDIKFDNGLIYSTNGRVLDPEAGTVVGTFVVVGSGNATPVSFRAMFPDSKGGRAYFLTEGFPGSSIRLLAYDLKTFLPLGSLSLPGVTGTPGSLVRWGANGLAFRTSNNQVVLLQHSLIAPPTATVTPAPTPAPPAFTISGKITEYSNNAIGGVTVTLSGAQSATSVTDANGNYSLGGLDLCGNATVTPSHVDYFFSPSSQVINSQGTPYNIRNGRLSVSFSASRVTHAINGRVTLPNSNTGVGGVTMTLSGGQAATALTDNFGNYSFSGLKGGVDYTITASKDNYTFDAASKTVTNLIGTQPVSFVGTPKGFSLSNTAYSVAEGGGKAVVAVNRAGDTTGEARINYATTPDASILRCDVINGRASERCDYANTLGTLVFAPGQTTASISIPIIDDTYREGNETITISLSDAAGAVLGGISAATVLITDNDFSAATSNPVDSLGFFVRQQYLDFLSREPEQAGYDGWMAKLNQCPASELDNRTYAQDCTRIDVSASFFRSREFSFKGYYVYRFYAVSFGERPLYADFIRDMRRVTGATDAEFEANRAAFPAEWAARSRFRSKYDALSNAQYVDELLRTPGVSSQLAARRGQWVGELDSGAKTRPLVLREIVESAEVEQRFYNEAFVAMQYFGYLRRDPDAAGYQGWLDHLNRTSNYREMVWGFLYSPEHKLRFGPVPGF